MSDYARAAAADLGIRSTVAEVEGSMAPLLLDGHAADMVVVAVGVEEDRPAAVASHAEVCMANMRAAVYSHKAGCCTAVAAMAVKEVAVVGIAAAVADTQQVVFGCCIGVRPGCLGSTRQKPSRSSVNAGSVAAICL